MAISTIAFIAMISPVGNLRPPCPDVATPGFGGSAGDGTGGGAAAARPMMRVKSLGPAAARTSRPLPSPESGASTPVLNTGGGSTSGKSGDPPLTPLPAAGGSAGVGRLAGGGLEAPKSGLFDAKGDIGAAGAFAFTECDGAALDGAALDGAALGAFQFGAFHGAAGGAGARAAGAASGGADGGGEDVSDDQPGGATGEGGTTEDALGAAPPEPNRRVN